MLASFSSSQCLHRVRLGDKCAIAQPRNHCGRRKTPVRAQREQGGFGQEVMKVAKRIQGSLPIVGLLSRLASPEGGFDDLAYTDYTRSVFDKGSVAMADALAEFEKMYGKVGSTKFVLLLLWMSKSGAGWFQKRDLVGAARRMRVTQDIEIEIDRFENSRAELKKKYEMMGIPEGKPEEKVELAVDSICTLCIGLKDGEAVPAPAVPLLTDMIVGGLDDATVDMVAACIAARPARSTPM